MRATKPGSEDNGNTNGSPEKQVVGGIAEFGNDIATLVELQAKLAMADLKESAERALVPMVLIALGLLFLFGALPVLLFGVAELVASALKIRTASRTVLKLEQVRGLTVIRSAAVNGVGGFAAIFGALRGRLDSIACRADRMQVPGRTGLRSTPPGFRSI